MLCLNKLPAATVYDLHESPPLKLATKKNRRVLRTRVILERELENLGPAHHDLPFTCLHALPARAAHTPFPPTTFHLQPLIRPSLALPQMLLAHPH